MLHAILTFLLIVLLVILIKRLEPTLLGSLFSDGLILLKKLLLILLKAGIVLGLIAIIYSFFESKEQEKRTEQWRQEQIKIEAENKIKQEEQEFQARAEQERQQELARAQAEIERQKQVKLYELDHSGPDSLTQWDWHVAGKTQGDTDYYVSWNQTKRMYGDNNKKQFWVRHSMSYGARITRVVVDCYTKTYRPETEVRYNWANEKDVKSVTDRYEAPFETINNGTVNGEVAKQICSRY